MKRRLVVAVIGAGDAPRAVCKLAFELGCEIARRGAVLISGGPWGVMEMAAAAARKNWWSTIGLIPRPHPRAPKRDIQFTITPPLCGAPNPFVLPRSPALNT